MRYRSNSNYAIKRQSLATAAVKPNGFPRLLLKRGSQRHQVQLLPDPSYFSAFNKLLT